MADGRRLVGMVAATLSLRVSADQERDLAIIRDIDPDRLRQIVGYLKGLPTPLVRVDELHTAAKRFLDTDEARILTRHLITLRMLCRHRETQPEEVLSALTFALRGRGWKDEELEKWQASARELRDLLALESIAVVAKEVDLSYNYAHLLAYAEILTDVRPVYDDGHTRIIGGIISQILRVTYFGDDGHHSLSIAMDERDVKRLQRSCTEALKKLEVAGEFIRAAGRQVVVPGEDFDVFSDS